MPGLKEKKGKIISEKGFLEAIEQFESEEQMRSFLLEQGLTEDEAKEIISSLEEYWSKTEESADELGEEALEEVSGGVRKRDQPWWWPWPWPGGKGKPWPSPFPRPRGWPWIMW